MTGNAARRMRGRPQPDGPAPFITLVELTWQQKKIENWIRFGRKSYEQILDRRRSIVGFAPNAIFAFVRWASNDFGTIISRIDIVRAVGRAASRSRHCRSCGRAATFSYVSKAGRRSARRFRRSTPLKLSASIRRTWRRSIGGKSTTV